MNYLMPQQTWANPTQLIPQQYLTPLPLPSQEKENGIVWIQGGKATAQAYPVAPGEDIVLRDSENPFAYFKSVGKDGKPQPMEIFQKVENEVIEKQEDLSEFIKKEDLNDYATHKDLDDIFKELQGIKETLLDLQTAPDQSDNGNNRRWK